METKKGLSSFQDCMPIFLLDNMDPTEWWRYLYEETSHSSYTGLINFIELFYKDYGQKDFGDSRDIAKNTILLKQKLLFLAKKIFFMQDQFEECIKEESEKILIQINRAVQLMPDVDLSNYPAIE